MSGAASAATGAGRTAPEVVLPHGGRLRGAWDGELRVFKGLRYARPPVGSLRFEPPQAEPPWQGLRDATEFGPVAPQWPRSGARQLGAPDCLRLNVWAPQVDAGQRLPVLVWVHGGGFFRGGASDALYDGASFARQGLVFVSIQYRLGVDGFAHLPDAAPNRGLLDQLAALRWVQDCIGAWGGDAQQVTVFGQSAGAGAIACLMGMAQSRGLFQRAILQSPSVACQTRDEAQTALQAIASLAGLAPTRAAFAAAPLEPLLQAVHSLAGDAALRRAHGLGSRQFFPLRPVIDGECLRAEPVAALAQDWAAQPSALQLLVGHNAEEMRLYHVPGNGLARIGPADVQDFSAATGLVPDPAAGGPGEQLCRLQSHYYYAEPARRLAQLAGRLARSSHRYEFGWRSPQWAGQLGAAHGVELPFVFNNLSAPTAQELAGLAAPMPLAQRMHGAWARFALTGDPGWPCHAGAAPWTETFSGPAAGE